MSSTRCFTSIVFALRDGKVCKAYRQSFLRLLEKKEIFPAKLSKRRGGNETCNGATGKHVDVKVLLLSEGRIGWAAFVGYVTKFFISCESF